MGPQTYVIVLLVTSNTTTDHTNRTRLGFGLVWDGHALIIEFRF